MTVLINGVEKILSKVKAETRALDAASGDVSYTGYGFKPTTLVCLACVQGVADVTAWGVADSALVDEGITQYYTPTFNSTGNFVFLLVDSGDQQAAIVKSLDTDGFTLTWTKAGTLSGDGRMKILALR